MTTGSCSCRHIRYTITIPPYKLVNCHCTECRKLSGAPYQTFAHFQASHIKWTTEPPTPRSSSPAAVRSFCPRCGSSISMAYRAFPDLLGITAGTIDWPEDGGDDGYGWGVVRPSCHIFLKEKAGWFGVPEDGLERYEGHFFGG